MPDPLVAALVAGIALVSWVAWRRDRVARRARARLGESAGPDAGRLDAPPLARRRLPRFGPALAAVSVGAIAALSGADASLALAFAMVAFALAHVLLDSLRGRRELQVEGSLADAIDLLIGALRAGVGVLDALESAAHEARGPLRGALERVVTRIRLGDDPLLVFGGLARQLPLPGARLFAFALTVHAESGGSLAPTLAGVARGIRDRVDLKRRIQAQATESRASVLGILGITWVLGLVMWRAQPERMTDFAASTAGAAMLAAALLLQAVGLLWMTRLTRLEV